MGDNFSEVLEQSAFLQHRNAFGMVPWAAQEMECMGCCMLQTEQVMSRLCLQVLRGAAAGVCL